MISKYNIQVNWKCTCCNFSLTNTKCLMYISVVNIVFYVCTLCCESLICINLPLRFKSRPREKFYSRKALLFDMCVSDTILVDLPILVRLKCFVNMDSLLTRLSFVK